jgi:acyl carrier protein
VSDARPREEILHILRGIEEVARRHLDLEYLALTDESGAPRVLSPDLRLVEDLALDSIQLLTLAVEVENRFEICMDPEDEEGIETVGDLADVVAGKLKGAPDAG